MRLNYEMRMNFKIRLRNPQFVFQFGLAFFAPICAYQGITGSEINSWPMLGDLLLQAAKNPFVVFSCVVGVYNAITDPTTPGFSDSDRAMTYGIKMKAPEDESKEDSSMVEK